MKIPIQKLNQFSQLKKVIFVKLFRQSHHESFDEQLSLSRKRRT